MGKSEGCGELAATWLMEHEPWDFCAVYFDAVDHFCHAFMPFHPPAFLQETAAVAEFCRAGGRGEEYPDGSGDAREAELRYDLLEREVVPRCSERNSTYGAQAEQFPAYF